MANDVWKGGDGNWSVAKDWSDGLPVAADDVVVSSGEVTATASIGTVAAIAIFGKNSLVAVEDARGGRVSGGVSVGVGAEFGLDILHDDGASTFDIDGALTNGGLLQIGDGDLSLAMTDRLSVGSLSNIGGDIVLDGCVGMKPHAFATLDVTGGVAGFGSAGVLEGQVSLASCALIEFAEGSIAEIAAKASLTLDGSDVFIADASNTTSDSALVGLNDCAGTLDLVGGAAVAVSGSLTNTGQIDIDGYSGGSSLKVAQTLFNDSTLVLGGASGQLSSSDFVSAGTLVNQGVITLHGDGTKVAALDVGTSLVNDGAIDISDEAEKVVAAVTGTAGVFTLDAGAALEFASAVGSGETVRFASASSAVLIDAASAFDAKLVGLANGDAIEFSHLSDTGLNESVTTFAGGFTLHLASAAESADLTFGGFAYDASDFQYLAFDGAKGLEVKFV